MNKYTYDVNTNRFIADYGGGWHKVTEYDVSDALAIWAIDEGYSIAMSMGAEDDSRAVEMADNLADKMFEAILNGEIVEL